MLLNIILLPVVSYPISLSSFSTCHVQFYANLRRNILSINKKVWVLLFLKDCFMFVISLSFYGKRVFRLARDIVCVLCCVEFIFVCYHYEVREFYLVIFVNFYYKLELWVVIVKGDCVISWFTKIILISFETYVVFWILCIYYVFFYIFRIILCSDWSYRKVHCAQPLICL